MGNNIDLRLKSAAETSSNTTSLVAIKTRPSTTPCRPLHRARVAYIDTVYVPRTRVSCTHHIQFTSAFLLFKELPSGVDIPRGTVEYGSTPEERCWSASAFAEKYDLKLVGPLTWRNHTNPVVYTIISLLAAMVPSMAMAWAFSFSTDVMAFEMIGPSLAILSGTQ